MIYILLVALVMSLHFHSKSKEFNTKATVEEDKEIVLALKSTAKSHLKRGRYFLFVALFCLLGLVYIAIISSSNY